jgi:hypothetical protein
MPFMTHVAGHLLSQRAFQHGLGHLGQQAVRAEQPTPSAWALPSS